ncbi:MAG: hypothetical protein HY323_07350 [Betaproteobacteria bacterium]|nr:hypothetical protein [Betaproteobacteria bacterium]
MNLLSECLAVSLPFTETDIGGTNTAGSDDTVHWTSMVGVERALVYVELGTWDAADDLDTANIEQATSSAGAGKKDLTTSSATGDYDTDTPIDADGDFIVFDIRPEDLDVANNFTHIRFYGAETGNTSADNISCVYVKMMSLMKPEQSGAAVAASKLYINKV